MLRVRLNRDESGLVVAEEEVKKKKKEDSQKIYLSAKQVRSICTPTSSTEHMHVDLLQQTHDKSIDLRQQPEEENNWETQGKHCGGARENKSSQPARIPIETWGGVSGLTDEQIPDTQQEVCREEGDSVKGEGLQAAGSAGQVQDPDHGAAQAEVDRPTVDDDPVVAL